MGFATVGDLHIALGRRLAEPGYADTYADESAFEDAVWTRLFEFMRQAGQNPSTSCLTSHTDRAGRSDEAWEAFCRSDCGPDVEVLGSDNRLDIVVKYAGLGSIGVEAKCLGSDRHAAKLTQGIGQAILALAHRDRALMMIHCGTVDTEERDRLRKVAAQICQGTKLAIVVVP